MMASIPNMRGTPLPAPTPKTAAAEAAPGNFAAQLPATPGQTIEPMPRLPPVPVEGAALAAPDIGDAIEPGEGEGEGEDKTEAKAEMPASELPQPAVVIPIVQALPVVPGPRLPPTVAAGDTPPAPPAAGIPEQIPAGTGDEAKTGLPVPGFADLPKDQAAVSEREAAIRELLQRKQVPAKPVVAAPAPAASPETARADAAPAAAPAAPVAIQAAEQPPPVQAALDARPATAKAGGAVEAPRSPDLATGRQLDLARDTEWLDRLARDIARAGANDAPLRFRLHPQSLGHLHVELQQGDHGTAVRLTVETEAARQLLADAQPRLAAEARAQGVRIAETHVDLANNGRDAPGDRRRQDETRQTSLIRTARGAGTEAAVASARSSGRARLDRYA